MLRIFRNGNMAVLEVVKLQQILWRYYSAPQVISSVPVIKVPAYVKKHLEKKAKEKALKPLRVRNRISYRGDTSVPVISSTNKEYNFYLGQRYNTFYPTPLLSKYWFKAKASGQKFTIHPWDSNPSLPVLYNKKHENEAYFPRTFPELLSDVRILQELKNKGFQCPTPVQVLAMPAILERKHLLLASETGAGKTVAYLAPIIQNICSIKETRKPQLFPKTPLAVIVTPGRELAEQIGTVAYDLCRSTDLKVAVLVSDGTQYKHLKLSETENTDILVASSGTFYHMVTKKFVKLGNLRHIVLDEADTLLDDSFIEQTKELLRRIPLYISSTENFNAADGTQLILVSSTYPLNADELLVEMFEKEDVIKIKSPYLHRILPHVRQRFWRVDNNNRAGVLLDLVKSDYEKKIPVVVFTTHSDTCEWLSHFLKDNDVPHVKFHAGLTSCRRAVNLEKFNSGVNTVMCCTDLASRGLDMQHVKHVINFDFPTSVSDYILRAGRVGRVGSNQGYVTNFIVCRAQVYAVQEIEKAVRCSTRIPDVDANIKRKINKLFVLPP